MPDPLDRLNAALSGRYRVESKVGEGGMATVYLANDLRHERKVALKVLRPELAAVVGAERFLAEIRTTANLRHPHLLPLFDSGEADGSLYYVMPYVEGESLRDQLDREKQLPVGEAVAIATKVAGALQAAHEAGVIHRDIKPANILLERGEPVLADFGIALAVQEAGGGRLTETGLSVGTPFYMSPEQATGDRRPGPESDVWAIGAVLYEMLVGEPPFAGTTAQAVLAKILTSDPTRPTALRKSIPGNVEAAVFTALERLPADRFTSAAHFGEALGDPGYRRVDAGRGARPAAALGRTGVVAGALVAVTTGFLGWVVGWQGGEGSLGPEVEPSLLTITVSDTAPPVWGIRISPDGSHLVYARPPGLWLKRPSSPDFEALPVGTGFVSDPAFSPDGRWIVYATGRTVERVAVSGGDPIVIAVLDETVEHPNWSDHGIAFLTRTTLRQRTLWTVPSAGGVPRRRADLPFEAGRIEWLPGGRGVLVFDRDSVAIHHVDLESGRSEVFLRDRAGPMVVADDRLLYADRSGTIWLESFDPDRLRLGGDPRPVLQGVGARSWGPLFDVSRSGSLVYTWQPERDAFGEGESELVLVGMDGSEHVLPIRPRPALWVEWSPLGDKIAFVGSLEDSGVYGGGFETYQVVYDVALGTRPVVSPPGAFLGTWSPDGSRILYRDASGVSIWDIQQETVDRRPTVNLGMPSHWFEEDRVLFTGGLDLSTLTLGDSARSQTYIEIIARPFWPRVSPDRNRVVYQSGAQRSGDLLVRSYPDAGPAVSLGVGTRPRWDADGSSVYYWVTTEAADTLKRVWLEGPTGLRPARSETILSGDFSNAEGWALHPDGDRFVIPRTGAPASLPSAPVRHFVVVDWLDWILQGGGGS